MNFSITIFNCYQGATRRLLRNSALHVLDNNGVVRAFEPMGSNLPLYTRIKTGGEWHTKGSYWTMLFDAKPETMKSLSRMLSLDDFVLRYTVIKLGDSLTATNQTSIGEMASASDR